MGRSVHNYFHAMFDPAYFGIAVVSNCSNLSKIKN